MNRGPLKTAILVTLAVVFALTATATYNYLLDVQLSGYRGRKNHDLEMIKRRDARRRMIPGTDAHREEILRQEFGALPEAGDVRQEYELVGSWQKLLMIMFAPFALGTALYVNLGRRRKGWQRVLRGGVILAGVAYALPLLLLPADALSIIRAIGVPLVIIALLTLLLNGIFDRLAANRAQNDATE